MASKAVIDTLIAEAGGEGEEGLIAAAWAIQQRAAANGVTIDQVVKSGFDGYTNPGSGAVKAQQDPALRSKVEQIMSRVESGEISNPVPGADHFLSGDVMPSWAKGMKLVATIGGHRFYASGKVPETAQGNSVATQLSVRQAPTPAVASPVTVAKRNRQNMTPAADLSAQSKSIATPYLTRDGQGVTDPVGTVLGKQMTTRLAQKPGQSQIERSKPRQVVQPANPSLAGASDRVRGNEAQTRNVATTIASIPTVAVGGPPTTRKVTSVPVKPKPGQSTIERTTLPVAKPGVTRIAGGIAGTVAMPPGVRPVVASTKAKPGQSIIERATTPTKPSSVAGFSGGSRKPYTGPNIPGPNGLLDEDKDPLRLATVGALTPPGPVGVRPMVQSAAMIAARQPRKVAPVPAVRMAAVMPRRVAPIPVIRSVGVSTQRSVTPQSSGSIADMMAAAQRAVSQSGDTSVGNQLDAAQARASGEGGRTRRY